MIKEYDQRITDQACEDAASYKTYKISEWCVSPSTSSYYSQSQMLYGV